LLVLWLVEVLRTWPPESCRRLPVPTIHRAFSGGDAAQFDEPSAHRGGVPVWIGATALPPRALPL
jgi:hypothetical protein